MFEFFIFILILCGAFWGSALVYVIVRGLSKKLEASPVQPVDLLLREELESLAGRLGRVEEELEFYKQLSSSDAGGVTPRLPPPEDQNS